MASNSSDSSFDLYLSESDVSSSSISDVDDNSSSVEDISARPKQTSATRKRRKDETVRRASSPLRMRSDNFGELWNEGYSTTDKYSPMIKFAPKRVPGIQIGAQTRQGKASLLANELSFFLLIFTNELIEMICSFTNKYAYAHIGSNKSYQTVSGDWVEVTPIEFKKFLACLIFMGIVDLKRQDLYWSTESLYSGSWARRLIHSRTRFRALMAFFRGNDPDAEDQKDKLRQVRYMYDYIRSKCKYLFQCYGEVAVDERIVQSKHRSGIRQYNKDKPTKWGIKLFVLADSKTGYTYSFDVYLGKRGPKPSHMGIGYDTVVRLMNDMTGQGYRVYTDNFYTSIPLLCHLKEIGILGCGVTAANRKYFPKVLKDRKSWSKKAQRGDQRWLRDENDVLIQQWKDNSLVTLLSTIHNGSESSTCKRRQKDAKTGGFELKTIQQPKSIQEYNANMKGVDQSDQLIGSYNVLKKVKKYWKVFFFHFLDISIVNAYILFKEYKNMFPERTDLQQKGTDQLSFRQALVRQLADIEGGESVPLAVRQTSNSEASHLPVFTESRGRCRVCSHYGDKQGRSEILCSNCEVHLCVKKNRNCFQIYHSAAYEGPK